MESIEWVRQFSFPFVTGVISGILLLLISTKLRGGSSGSSSSRNKNRSAADHSGESEFSFAENFGELKMTLVIRNDLKMGKGKAAAQCSHAAVMAHEIAATKCPSVLRDWKMNGQRKIVVKTESEGELLQLAENARKEGLVYAIVRDAGLTQIQSGTRTVLAVGPGPADVIDKITGHLKLY
ncbi:UNVERIFIED_CONTAM: hypothetical protein PYX00_006380 [Menopon gallinae]|uniref:peptidyl-tRNA hydrolase n=1 Tax=Menopon gallinae TaxID=328185 RepID=A0AAW2HWI2_9NEOP